jgi:pSer/pThr/pTyr-binding forkhead associated (FHA) protein
MSFLSVLDNAFKNASEFRIESSTQTQTEMNSESLDQKNTVHPIEPPQLIIQGNGSVETLTLSGRTIWTFGRGKKSTVQLDDPNASRVHAQLAIYPDNSCHFVDLKSRNGTLINDEVSITPKLLKHGDRISIGNTVMVFENLPTGFEDQVLMLHASAAQAAFWQEILAFQGVSVLKEVSISEFKRCLDLNAASDQSPKVLLIDVRAHQGDCYQFCRWIRQKHPQHQTFLLDSKRNTVSNLERQVAIKNGALNQFPAMSRRDLVLNSTEVLRQVNEVLQVLEAKLIGKEELLSILRTNKTLKDWHSAESKSLQAV